MTRHPEEGTLHAYIDGELPSAESAELEAHIAACAQCAAALAEARGFVAAASRAISALDSAPVAGAPSPPARVLAPPPRVAKRSAYSIPFARAAALLLLAGGTAVVVTQSGTIDGEKRAPIAAVTADGATAEERAMVTAPTGMAQSAPEIPPPARELSTTRNAAGQGAVAQKTAPSSRESAVAVNDMAAEGRQSASPAAASPRAALSDQLGRVGASPTMATALPAPPTGGVATTARAARLERGAEAVTLSAANPSATRVTRLRTKDGVVLTLTDEPLRTSFAEETATAAQRPARAMAPSSAAPAVNSFRWSNPGEGRTFTLTGLLPVAELEAASKRLSELERLP